MKLIESVKSLWQRMWAQNMDISALLDVGYTGTAGVPINRYNILTYAPIWYSVNKMAGHLGQMPKLVQREVDGQLLDVTREQSNLGDLLNQNANNFMTSMDAVESVQKDAVIDGNGRLGIVRQGNQITSLIPIHPESAWCFISYPAGDQNSMQSVSETSPYRPLYDAVTKWHYVTAANGDTFLLQDRDVLHIKGLQHDGVVGMPMWYQARNSISGALASEEHVNRTLANNGIPGMILEAPAGVLTDNNKAKEFLDTFREHHEGAENASKTALLRYGVSAKQLSQTSRDGQMIENRKFSRDEAWMWTGDMLFYDGGSAYSNQQERDEAYKTHTLSRWISKWEAECNSKLLNPEKRFRGWRITFEVDAILRGSLKARLEAYEIARRIGYLSQEEIRRRDGLPEPEESENFDNPNTSSSSDDSPQEAPAAPETAAGSDGEEDAETVQNRYTGDLERDEWIYLQHAAGELTLEEITYQVADQNPSWDPIGTVRAIRNASHRYADYHNLPRVNRNIMFADAT